MTTVKEASTIILSLTLLGLIMGLIVYFLVVLDTKINDTNFTSIKDAVVTANVDTAELFFIPMLAALIGLGLFVIIKIYKKFTDEI